MFQATQARAQAIAKTVDPNIVKFDPVTIITIIANLLPEIIKCFAPKNPAQAKVYLNKRYNAANAGDKYGGFRPLTVKAIMPHTKREMVKEGQTPDDDAAREIAVKTLNDIRTGADTDQQAVLDEIYLSMAKNPLGNP